MRRYAVCLAFGMLACEKPAAAPTPEQSPSAALQPAPAEPARDPHAGMLAPAAAVPTGPVKAGGLTWTAPPAFVRRAPKSSMRVAEYGIEGAPKAELGVFYFGADQGGSVDANITRWIGQFTQADGSPAQATRAEREVHGIAISTVETSGTFGGGMAIPGAPAPTSLPDAMLLGAIAKGSDGAVFFKFTGPKATLEASRGAFDALIQSIEPSK